jgi:peroxidase
VYEGGVDPLMRGLITVPAKLKKPEQNLNSDLTERLFTTFHAVALDLAAINIQRGRDHAIKSYMAYREFCNLPTSKTFEGLADISNEHVKQKLKELYGHPDNIDIWAGGILEDQVPGAKVGPLFRCLLIEQMKRLRDGDRFYYENPSVFKPEQLAEIKQTNLGRVLCDNGDNITRVTEDVFVLPSRQGGYKECKDVPMISLRVWTDCSDCNQRTAYNLDITKLPRRSRSRRDLKAVNDENSIEHDDVHLNSKIDNDYSDMNEERIEGLEALIESFQKTLKRMRREIQKLKDTNEDLAKAINFTHYQSSESADKNASKSDSKLSKHHYQCVDKKGINRLNNEIWMEDDCTNCLCQHHQITCTTEKCPEEVPKCEPGFVVRKKNSQCCPTCLPDQKSPLSDETTITSNVTNSR